MQKIKEKLILISIILLIFLLSLNSIYAKEVNSENMRYTDDNVKNIENTLSDSSRHIVEIDKDTENILCSTYSSKKSDKLNNKADNAKFKSSKKSSQICDLNKESKSSKESSQLDELDDEDYIYHINSTNLDTYFSNGVLKDDFKESLLVFDGEFVDKGIFTISSPNVQILGNNSLFRNTVFCLNSNNILLSSFNFVLDDTFSDNDDAGILILGDNNTVYNCTMNYTVPTDCNGICVYAKGDISNKINGFNLIRNTFNFNGNNLNECWDYGVFLEYVDNALAYANRINASLPLRTVDWIQMFEGVRIDSVAGFVADTCENLTLLNNRIITNVTSCGDNIIYPTLNTVMIYACNNSVIEKNFIYSTDFYSKNGKDNYLQGIDLFFSNNVTIINNQIHMRTTGGCEDAGTAYPIEITGPAQVHIAYNNLTSVNKGPNIGIFSHDFYGKTRIEIISNFINITGLSSKEEYGLVTGIEVQDSDDLIWNNTIIVTNLGDFADNNNVYGISYAQSTEYNHTYNIQYNNVTTNGNNTVALSKDEEFEDESLVINSIIANNILNGYSSSGDESVYIGEHSQNNNIANNTADEFINTLSFDDLPDWLKNHKTRIPIIPRIIIPKHTNENSNGSGTTENTGNGTTIVPKPNPENGSGINNNTNSTILSNNTEINSSKINENIDPNNTETINKTSNTIPSNNTPKKNELNNATSNEIPQQNSNITNNKDTPKRPDNTNNELNEDTSNTHEISDKPGNNEISKNQNNDNSNNKNQNHASSISLKILGKSISKQKSASPKEGGSSAANNKVYELKEKTKEMIQDNNHIAAILMSLIIILLVFAGYKRKNKQEE